MLNNGWCMTTVLRDGHTVPEAAKARGRKGADSQKQNLKVRGVHIVYCTKISEMVKNWSGCKTETN